MYEVTTGHAIRRLCQRLDRDGYAARHVQREPACGENQQQRDRSQQQNVNRFDTLNLTEHAVKVFVLRAYGRSALSELGRELARHNEHLRVICAIG